MDAEHTRAAGHERAGGEAAAAGAVDAWSGWRGLDRLLVMRLPAPSKAAFLAAFALAACARAQGGIEAGAGGAYATSTGTGGQGGRASGGSGAAASTSSTGSTASAGGSTCTGGEMCSVTSSTGSGGSSSTATTTTATTTSTSAGAGGATCVVPAVTNLAPANLGALTGVPQSFNETRALAITPAADALVSSMTLTGLNATGASATVGARIYDAASHALVAEATAGIGPGSNETVAVTLGATLTAGTSYMVGFFVSDGQMASATLFQPTTVPYSAGPFTITALGDIAADAYPSNVNEYAPLVTIQSCGP
jgi:hypothetical protein